MKDSGRSIHAAFDGSPCSEDSHIGGLGLG